MTEERRDERIDRIVSEAVRREYGETDPPREAMWASIEAERRTGRLRPGRRAWWGALAAAAVLAALVFGLARYAGEPSGGTGRDVEPALPPTAATPVNPDDLLLRGHLARAGALLDSFARGAPVAARWDEARPLLATTRVLMADPALEEPAARLLADAEIALALVVRAGDRPGSTERAVLDETVADGRLARRLRDAAGTL